MNNPFETIIARLDSLEQLVNRALNQSSVPQHATLGSISLAQEVLRLSKSRIYTLCSQGLIPVAKRGGRLTFNRADLEAWIAEGKRTVQD
jgi:excisionase family DNA binding protein